MAHNNLNPNPFDPTSELIRVGPAPRSTVGFKSPASFVGALLGFSFYFTTDLSFWGSICCAFAGLVAARIFWSEKDKSKSVSNLWGKVIIGTMLAFVIPFVAASTFYAQLLPVWEKHRIETLRTKVSDKDWILNKEYTFNGWGEEPDSVAIQYIISVRDKGRPVKQHSAAIKVTYSYPDYATKKTYIKEAEIKTYPRDGVYKNPETQPR